MSQGKTSTTARVYRRTPRTLVLLAAALKRGELVAVPTETVYGLAGNALDPAACRRIFKAKGRPTNDPLIVHIHELKQLDALAERNQAVEKVAQAFWPGPLTIVLSKKAVVDDIVTSGRPSVAVRMPRHAGFRALLKACGLPLAAPSANPFGYISPTSAAHVLDSLGKKIRYILDGGEADIGLESTILDLRDPKKPAILRPGAIGAAEIGRVLGRRVRAAAKRSATKGSGMEVAALAPGMLTKHYSPRTPITLHARLSEAVVKRIPSEEAVVFTFKPNGSAVRGKGTKNVFWLGERGNLVQVARRLFALLRELDRGQWKRIHAELAPGRDGLALAINDRLTRAAAKR